MLISYSVIGISPCQLSTSDLFSQIPRTPFTSITSDDSVVIGSVEFRIACSILLTYDGNILSDTVHSDEQLFLGSVCFGSGIG